jgi:hypothetical protein
MILKSFKWVMSFSEFNTSQFLWLVGYPNVTHLILQPIPMSMCQNVFSNPIAMIRALRSQCRGLCAIWPQKIHSSAELFYCNVGLFLLTFFTFCYFLLLFLLFVSFVNYFFNYWRFTVCYFILFYLLLVTFINYFLLLRRARGIIFIHCLGGAGAPWFFFLFFYCWGGGGWRLMFFFAFIWHVEGGRERDDFFF